MFTRRPTHSPPANLKVTEVAVVIPALNEEGSIAAVVLGMRRAVQASGAAVVVVVGDNASTDNTAAVARAAGAQVVHAARKGYGSACLAALAHVPHTCSHVLFCDADGADSPTDVAALLHAAQTAQLVIGVRSRVQAGALTLPQRFGNALAGTLLHAAYGQPTQDLGPFRVMHKPALDALRMDDKDFGWTVQMQARAARAHMHMAEVPVQCLRRTAGRSKVSGTVRGSVMAGKVILSTLWRERSWRPERDAFASVHDGDSTL